MIYIHGYTEGLSTKSVQTVISAYQKRNDTNIFVLNWQNYSSGNYITDAIPHAIGVSYTKVDLGLKSRNFLMNTDWTLNWNLHLLLGRAWSA
jgi:hypothetical protein